MPPIVSHQGVEYKWDPAKSTPSWPRPIPEMARVLQKLQDGGVKTIADVGCGNGRNRQILSDRFERVRLVEVERNIEKLNQMVAQDGRENVIVQESSAYFNSDAVDDAALLTSVLHTIPGLEVRKSILEKVSSHIPPGGYLVVGSPSFDAKYREKYLSDQVEFEDGIVRLYPDKTFSFYRNYSREEVRELLVAAGLDVVDLVPGDHRYSLIARSAE